MMLIPLEQQFVQQRLILGVILLRFSLLVQQLTSRFQ